MEEQLDRAVRGADRKLCITTSFSGGGAAELALAMLHHEFTTGSEAGSMKDPDTMEGVLSDDEDTDSEGATQLMMYSACDVDPTCQRILAGHPIESRPRHIFCDVLARLPAAVYAKCKAIEQDKLLAFEQAGASAAADHQDSEDFDSEDFALDELPGMVELKSQLGSELVEELCEVLEQCEFSDTAWCVRHAGYCYFGPTLCTWNGGCFPFRSRRAELPAMEFDERQERSLA